MDKKLKNFVISAMRKATYAWKPRSEAKRKAKVKVGEFSTGRPKYGYRCASCQEVFMAKEVKIDHIEPVVPLEGYKSGMDFDLNEYAERMFCSVEGFSVLCDPCHDAKTKQENITRRANKKS